jgi:hypothetical protein
MKFNTLDCNQLYTHRLENGVYQHFLFKTMETYDSDRVRVPKCSGKDAQGGGDKTNERTHRSCHIAVTAQLRQLLRAGDFNKNDRRVFHCPKGYRVSMRRRKDSHSRVECYDSLEDLVCC